MRALLVVNPAATTTSPGARDVIARALGSDLKVDVALTERRGHARELAEAARRDGFDIVIALGGDGTVNEVVNGLLTEGPTPSGGGFGSEIPMLGVVPGGSTNVFARAVGIAPTPIEATSQILDAVREQRVRRIGLGKADDRYFTFCAGFGMDAEVISRVERARTEQGKVASSSLVLRTAVKHFFLEADRSVGQLSFTSPDGTVAEGVHTLIIANTAPWTYLGNRPVNPVPKASFERGLDVVSLTSMGTAATAGHLARMLSGSGKPLSGRHADTFSDLSELLVQADQPTAFQLDGDSLGTRTRVTLRSVPDALSVLV